MKPELVREGAQYFMLVSTGREVLMTRSAPLEHNGSISFHGDVLQFLTQDTTESVFFKLFEEGSPPLRLAEAKFSPQMLLVTQPAFTRVPAMAASEKKYKRHSVKFSRPGGGASEGSLELSLMYRASEFTKSPRGRLELNLESSRGATRDKQDYQPVMEFVLGDQRIFVDEHLLLRKNNLNQESEFRRWT